MLKRVFKKSGDFEKKFNREGNINFGRTHISSYPRTVPLKSEF